MNMLKILVQAGAAPGGDGYPKTSDDLPEPETAGKDRDLAFVECSGNVLEIFSERTTELECIPENRDPILPGACGAVGLIHTPNCVVGPNTRRATAGQSNCQSPGPTMRVRVVYR